MAFHLLIHSLSLPICFRMISCAHIQLCSCFCNQQFPESTSEKWISIRYDHTRHVVQLISRNTSATFWALEGCLSGIKWPCLENLSITTRMQLYWDDWGRPLIKSIDTVSHALWGTGKGYNSPGWGTLSGLAFWQTKQDCTCVNMNFFIPYQVNKAWILL